MRVRLGVLLLVASAAACPGQRRPDPRLRPPRGTELRVAPRPSERRPASTPTVPAADLAELRRRSEALRARVADVPAEPSPAQWQDLMNALDRLQSDAFSLQERAPEEEADALYELLESLELLRAELVDRQPR